MKAFFDKIQDLQIKKLYLSGLTMQKIAERYNSNEQPVRYSLQRTKTQIRKYWERASREKSGKWKGGKRIIKGYLHLLVPNHPLARKDGYIAEHRIIMEQKLGRYLLKTEVVNHIDKNIKNNDPNNLEVFANNGEHIRFHLKDFKRGDLGQFHC